MSQGPEPLKPRTQGKPGDLLSGRGNTDTGRARGDIIEGHDQAGREFETAEPKAMTARELTAHATKVRPIANERTGLVVLSKPQRAGDQKAPGVVACARPKPEPIARVGQYADVGAQLRCAQHQAPARFIGALGFGRVRLRL